MRPERSQRHVLSPNPFRGCHFSTVTESRTESVHIVCVDGVFSNIADCLTGHRSVKYPDKLVLQQRVIRYLWTTVARTLSVTICGVRSVRLRPLVAASSRDVSQVLPATSSRSVHGEANVPSGGCLPRRTQLQPLCVRRRLLGQYILGMVQGQLRTRSTRLELSTHPWICRRPSLSSLSSRR